MPLNLFEHQQRALDLTKDRKRVAYFLDMGLGKTYVGAEKMMQIGNETNIVVCQKSKITDWIEHFETNYPAKVFDLTKKLTDFMAFSDQKIGVINYDLIWRRKDFTKLKGFTLMLDESSEIQNASAKRTKFILKLKADALILLSGTPVGGKYENLWSQLKLMGYDITKAQFDSMYVNWNTLDLADRRIKVVDKANPYKNVDRLKKKLHEHGAVFQKTEEVFTLPDQNFQVIKVPKPQGYDRFKKNSFLIKDGNEITGENSLTKLLGYRQLCGRWSKEKLEAVKDMIASTNERLVIFYNFNTELELLKGLCADRPVSEVNGSKHDLAAYEKEGDSITLVQYQAGAKGLNLQKCCRIIYFTLPLSSENFEQSKKRIHRIGQDRPCFYYIPICQGTIEMEIMRTLERKKDFTDDLFKGVENGSRKEF